MDQRQLQEFPGADILIPPNVRGQCEQEAIDALAGTIAVHGVLSPPGVYLEEGQPVLLYGETRLRAAMKAGLETLPCFILPAPADETERQECQLVENLARRDLNPLDKAIVFARVLKARGWTLQQLADRVGLSKSLVAKHLPLLELTSEIQEEIRRGRISLSAAYELSRVKEQPKQAELAAQVSGGTLSRDGIVAAAQEAKRRTTAARKRTSAVRATLPLGEGRSITAVGPDLDLDQLLAWMEEALAKVKQAREARIELKTFLDGLRRGARPTAR